MSYAPLRVAVVGCGLIGRRRAGIIHRSVADQLVIVADVDESRVSAVSREFGCLATADWKEAVSRDDVDAVVVSTPNKWLAPVAIASLGSGKHVLVEKPMARNPAEAEAILSAGGLRPGGARPVVKVGFNHRYHKAVQKAHELFGRGAIGEPCFLRCRYGHGGRPGYEKEWRADPDTAGGGEMLDQGIHAVDLFRWFLGDFREVMGYTANFVWKGPNSGAEDNAFALFRTAAGQVASLHASWTQWKNVFSFEIFGQEGYLIVEGLGGSYGPERLVWGRRLPESGPPKEERFEFPGPDDSWGAEWEEFAGAVREGREPLASGVDGWKAMKMVFSVYESSRTGGAVRL